MKENCAICKHHDVFWEGSGCNLINHFEKCRFEARLLPCPFCGRLPRFIENKANLKEILYGLCCDDEHHEVCVGYFYTEEEAIEAWNRRY